jgi:hypothetical protein
MGDVIFVLMRWMHIASVATLIGGMIFGCAVLSRAAAMLITRPKNPRRARMMTGAAISGLAIIAISAYLRHIY